MKKYLVFAVILNCIFHTAIAQDESYQNIFVVSAKEPAKYNPFTQWEQKLTDELKLPANKSITFTVMGLIARTQSGDPLNFVGARYRQSLASEFPGMKKGGSGEAIFSSIDHAVSGAVMCVRNYMSDRGYSSTYAEEDIIRELFGSGGELESRASQAKEIWQTMSGKPWPAGKREVSSQDQQKLPKYSDTTNTAHNLRSRFQFVIGAEYGRYGEYALYHSNSQVTGTVLMNDVGLQTGIRINPFHTRYLDAYIQVHLSGGIGFDNDEEFETVWVAGTAQAGVRLWFLTPYVGYRWQYGHWNKYPKIYDSPTKQSDNLSVGLQLNLGPNVNLFGEMISPEILFWDNGFDFSNFGDKIADSNYRMGLYMSF